LGEEPDGRPVAELWFGAHPDDPAAVPSHCTTLDALIAADPDATLGSSVVAEFGPRLPFLLKVLAAQSPLSLQVHPTRVQAEAGYAREDERGVPRGTAQRNYRDRNHKPELLLALTPFDALCGFRPVPATLRLIDAMGVTRLAPVRELLAGPDGLRAAFTALLRNDEPETLVKEVSQAAERLVDHPEWDLAARVVRRSATAFPGDPGVLLTLLLNAVRLAPGEATYLSAGSVHSYLGGTGIEIMANSDNVLRCGLTAKHVDVDEVLAVTDFTELAQPRWQPSRAGPGRWRFQPPVSDFALTRVELAGRCELGADPGPRVVLCTEGTLAVHAADLALHVSPGRAVFVAAGEAASVTGSGLAAIAAVGRPSG
jgi:mannose-6-phosphate isomerase